MVRKYPIGEQHFRKIRRGGKLYVDKTRYIHELVTTGSFYFLSRPRRFGKSLLIDTIAELFSGSKELFEGLWIAEHWDWSKTNPVLHFNFNELDYKELGLSDALKVLLAHEASARGITITSIGLKSQFKELIERVGESSQVVILIDEYDKPLLDYLGDSNKVEEHRDIMKDFYSVLKGAGNSIRFLLFSGVSRFSKMSVFSDLNNLNDITLSNRFGAICGITQEELERDFTEEIAILKQKKPDILEDIKKWYNGYSWDVKTKVYNPFSLLNFMAEPVFRNYWFATGSPSFLIKGIRAKGEYDFDQVTSSENKLGDFDPANVLSVPLLFQTGYLTIKSYNQVTRNYTLGYPNVEVKDSLLDNLLSAYRGIYPDSSNEETGNLLLAVNEGNVEKIITALNDVIGTVPYDHWKADTESIFHIIVLLTFQKIGVDVYSEVHSSLGRCDILIKTEKFIYVLELKRDGSAIEALNQIINTNYLQPFVSDKRKKIALGVSFSSKDRCVADYKVKEI